MGWDEFEMMDVALRELSSNSSKNSTTANTSSADVGSLAGYTTPLWFLLSLYLLNFMRQYAIRSMFKWHTYLTVFIAYFCSFGIVLLIPIDLALTIKARSASYAEGETNSFIETQHKLKDLYRSLYWPGLVMGSLVLVVMENFNQDGHFTARTRLASSLKVMAYWYSIGGLAGIILFAIVIGGGYVSSSSAFTVTIIALNNTMGLVFIVVMLGYGLIEWPRNLWANSNLEKFLARTQQKAAAEFKRLSDESLQISLSVAHVIKTNEEVQRSKDNELVEAMSIVMADCPKEFTSATLGEVQRDKKGKVTIDVLAQLRRKLNIEKANYRISQSRVEKIKRVAYYLEDVIASLNREDGVQKIKWSFGVPESTHLMWLWHTKYRPFCLKASSLVCSVLSLFVLLGVMSELSSTDFSVFSIAVHSHSATTGGITVFTLLTLGYVSFVVSWGLSQMRVANMMEVQPDQQTTPKSMSFNSRMCARLAPPIVFFYLGLTYENGVKKYNFQKDQTGKYIVTGFSNFYGQMTVVPFIGDTFNTTFPIVILIISVFTLLNVFNRILVFLKLQRFQFGDVAVTEEELREGRRQLARHRKQVERAVQRDQTRQKLTSMKKKTYFNSISKVFRFGNKGEPIDSSDGMHSPVAGIEEGNFVPPPPPEKAGWLDKKGSKTMGLSAGWQPRYFVIRNPGHLYYYKTDNTDVEEHGVIDLRLVIGIKHTPGTRDGALLGIELADRVIKVRARTEIDAFAWKDALLQWSQYAVANAAYLPSVGVVDKDDPSSQKDHKSSLDDDVDFKMSEVARQSRIASVSNPLLKPAAAISPARPTISIASPTGSPVKQGPSTKDSEFGAKPHMLEGYLEKKSHKNLRQWQQRYFKVNEATGFLEYFVRSSSTEPSGSIDLRMVADITEDGHDPCRFTIEMGEDSDRDYKLRAKNVEMAKYWANELGLWREYILLNMGLDDA